MTPLSAPWGWPVRDRSPWCEGQIPCRAPLGPGRPLTHCLSPRVASDRPRLSPARHTAGLSPGLAKMREGARVGLSANVRTQGVARRWGRMCVSPVRATRSRSGVMVYGPATLAGASRVRTRGHRSATQCPSRRPGALHGSRDPPHPSAAPWARLRRSTAVHAVNKRHARVKALRNLRRRAVT